MDDFLLLSFVYQNTIYVLSILDIQSGFRRNSFGNRTNIFQLRSNFCKEGKLAKLEVKKFSTCLPQGNSCRGEGAVFKFRSSLSFKKVNFLVPEVQHHRFQGGAVHSQVEVPESSSSSSVDTLQT